MIEEVILVKILVWGTGRIAGKIVGKWIALEDIEAFIDNNTNIREYMGVRVIQPSDLISESYDAIIVANLFGKEIREQCLSMHIDVDKVIFPYENMIMKDMNKDYLFIEKILGKEYADKIRNRYHMVRGTEEYGTPNIRRNVNGGYNNTDYVRIQCFDFVVKEMRKRKLNGSVAEVGVFKGEFAQYINVAFPDSKLYLFDTFEGFDAKEALQEVKNGNCSDSFVQAYKNTNIAKVLNKMKYLNNIEVKQGFFPDSLDGLEDMFQFVSIDVDFEESIYNALVYFYPRMIEGGYIFVHDYNSDLRGVEKAVDRYETENGPLKKMPICDANGTMVILK